MSARMSRNQKGLFEYPQQFWEAGWISTGHWKQFGTLQASKQLNAYLIVFRSMCNSIWIGIGWFSMLPSFVKRLVDFPCFSYAKPSWWYINSRLFGTVTNKNEIANSTLMDLGPSLHTYWPKLSYAHTYTTISQKRRILCIQIYNTNTRHVQQRCIIYTMTQNDDIRWRI